MPYVNFSGVVWSNCSESGFLCQEGGQHNAIVVGDCFIAEDRYAVIGMIVSQSLENAIRSHAITDNDQFLHCHCQHHLSLTFMGH